MAYDKLTTNSKYFLVQRATINCNLAFNCSALLVCHSFAFNLLASLLWLFSFSLSLSSLPLSFNQEWVQVPARVDVMCSHCSVQTAASRSAPAARPKWWPASNRSLATSLGFSVVLCVSLGRPEYLSLTRFTICWIFYSFCRCWLGCCLIPFYVNDCLVKWRRGDDLQVF